MKKFIIGILLAFVLLGAAGFVLAKTLSQSPEPVSPPVTKTDQVAPTEENKEPVKQEETNESIRFFTSPVNILVIGIDQRGNEQSRTDTIMVYHLDPIKKTVSMLSVPRDTYVNIPGRGMDKVNHAYAFGGINLSRATLEQFLGIKIDYYVETNFKSFVKFIDSIGGITIDVEKDIKGKNIKKGLQTLNGTEALAYVRDRKDPMADIARVGRQQKFVRALAKEISRKDNNLELTVQLPEIYSNLETDLPLDGAKDLVNLLKGMVVNNATMKTVPGWFYNLKGVSYWKPDVPKTKALVNQIFY